MIAAILLGLALTTTLPASDRFIALTHVNIIDGTGGEPVHDATLLMHGGRIRAVGTDVSVPKGAATLDYRGRTLMPGLITNHSHVGLVAGTDGNAGNYSRATIVAALAQYRRYGVTTVVALGANGPLFNDLRREAHGNALPTDLYGANQGIGVANGAPPQAMMNLAPDQLYRPDTPEQARDAVNRMADAGTDLVKLWLDDFGGSMPAKMSPAIYSAVIDAAHRRGLRVAAHIHDLDDAVAVVEAGADILAHGVRDQLVTPAFIAQLKQKGTWYIPTLALDEASVAWAEPAPWTRTAFARAGLTNPALIQRIDDRQWQQRTGSGKQADAARAALAMNLRNLKTLYEAGVNIGFGSDSGATAMRVPGVAEHRELALMRQAGLSTREAIRIATSAAAQLMKLDDRGVLAPGKRADLIVLDGDPLSDPGALDRIVETWENATASPGPLVGAIPPE